MRLVLEQNTMLNIKPKNWKNKSFQSNVPDNKLKNCKNSGIKLKDNGTTNQYFRLELCPQISINDEVKE